MAVGHIMDWWEKLSHQSQIPHVFGIFRILKIAPPQPHAGPAIGSGASVQENGTTHRRFS